MRWCLWSAGFVVVAIAGANKSAELASDPGSDTRIIGGQVVDPAWSYPFLVGISEVGFSCCMCGGSLISSEWVLTAAHCIESGKAYRVLVYGHAWKLDGQNHRCTQQINVAETICHEGYDTGSNEADVCLLRLAYAPNCADEMEAGGQFALLDDGASGRENAGTAVSLAGWGLTDEEGSEGPDLMHHVTTTMVAFSDCNAAYASTLVEGSMICAGEPEGGKDSCQGDSGGPLFVKENGSFFQVGIVSFGVGCGRASHPGVYASVAHYLPWITDKITSAPSIGCTNVCLRPGDGSCDDGGPGSEYSICDLNTDCADCGARNQGAVCYDLCTYASDGECDDGGAGAEYTSCDLGFDCTDCGYRNVSPSLPPSFTPSPPPSFTPSPPPSSAPSPPPSLAQSPPPSFAPSPPPPPSLSPGTSACVASSSQCASSCTANSCADCGCAGCAYCREVVVRVVASGSVSDYESAKSLAFLQSRFALAAEVDKDTVTVSVAAGSVVITAVIEPTTVTAEEIELRLKTAFSLLGASFVLGVDVEEDPTISREGEGSWILGLSLPFFIAVAAGAVVGVVLLVSVLICVICCGHSTRTLGRKRGASNVSPADVSPAPANAVRAIAVA